MHRTIIDVKIVGAISSNTVIIIGAVIGGLGPTIAVIINIVATRARLSALKESADKNMAVTEHVQVLVNSQNSRLVRLLAQVSRRVATDNPNDAAAQDAAMSAERDAASLPPD